MPSTVTPVTAEIDVPVDPKTAFRLYVTRPGRQHPVEGLSGKPAEIIYEPFAEGRWYERSEGGGEFDWGRVLEWDPPHRLVLAWMVGTASGTWAFDPDPAHASRAEITFEPIDGGTRVRVTHTGFEAHGSGTDSIRGGVSGRGGWAEDFRDLARAAAFTTTQRAAVTGMQVNLFCRDVEACLAFYTQLGLHEAFRFPKQGAAEHVEVDAAGTRIGLTSAEAANRLAGLGVVPRSSPAAEVALWCDNVDALFAKALAAGGTTLAAPTESPDGRLRYGWILDPEGHQLKFVQRR